MTAVVLGCGMEHNFSYFIYFPNYLLFKKEEKYQAKVERKELIKLSINKEGKSCRISNKRFLDDFYKVSII